VSTAAALAAGTWTADPARSTAGFAVERRPFGTLRGRFDRLAAELTVAADGAATLTGSVHTASLVLPGGDGAARAASAEVLDTVRFPHIRFRSCALDLDGELVQLDGRLTVKAITLSVAAAGRLVRRDDDGALLLTLETVVDRRQFGVASSRPAAGGAAAFGHETRLQADLVLCRSRVP
jgi:polyisoprenoid-binding protein YceI